MTSLSNLISLSPAMAEREWRKHLADQSTPFEGELAKLAAWVGLSIKAWRGSVGKKNEDAEGQRQNVAARIAAYGAERLKLAAD